MRVGGVLACAGAICLVSVVLLVKNRECLLLAHANVRGMNFARCNCGGITASYTDMTGVNLDNARLPYARLNQVIMKNARLNDASLAWSDIRNTSFESANMGRAYMRGVRFTLCDLRNAELDGANLQNVWFNCCDLSGAKLTGADLKNSGYDSGTIWPKGFKPMEHGSVPGPMAVGPDPPHTDIK